MRQSSVFDLLGCSTSRCPRIHEITVVAARDRRRRSSWWQVPMVGAVMRPGARDPYKFWQ